VDFIGGRDLRPQEWLGQRIVSLSAERRQPPGAAVPFYEHKVLEAPKVGLVEALSAAEGDTAKHNLLMSAELREQAASHGRRLRQSRSPYALSSSS
jgi:hypothetical protein